MTTETLSNFLAKLSLSLEVFLGSESASQVKAMAESLRPFATLNVVDLTAFLQKAEEYQKAGTVVADPPGVASLRQAMDSLHIAVKAPELAEQIAELQSSIAESLIALGQSVGLTVAKPKVEKKWLESIRAKAATEAVVVKLKAVAVQVSSVESLAEEAVVQGIEEIASTPADVLKAAASAVGAATGGKAKGRDLVLQALAALTKLPLDPKAKATKAPKAAKSQADDATILSLTSELKAMAARATNPDAVSDDEIEAILSKVEASGLSDAQMKEIALSLTGVKESTKNKAFLAIRGQLVAAKRILENRNS